MESNFLSVEAVRLAEANLRRVGRDDPQLLNTLAAAYAEVGRFEEAVSIAEKVLSHLSDPQHGPIASQVRSQLRLYRMRQPHRSPQPTPTGPQP